MEQERKGEKKMKTICILNNKGGVGKTVTTTTVAHLLGEEHNKKVLVIDVDPQGNTTNLFGGADVIELLVSLLQGEAQKRDTLSVENLLIDATIDVHDCIRATEYKNIDIIPAFLTLSEVEEQLKADIRTPQQFRLKNHLEKIKDEYDYCIIDCSPSISLVNINGLASADEVFIPMRCDAWSAVGMCIATNLVETVKTFNPKLKVGGCFFTQWNGRKNISKEVYELLNKCVPDTLIPIKISVGKDAEEISFTQKPLGAYESRRKNKSKVLTDYMLLTEYIVSNDRKGFVKKLSA